eukprot:GDKI01046290.1.p2 GENE.GDKI01046290.1~~GDKI01046290.1.p2  ORF type:complete len:485 (-),score=185.54 GDKI01046290.1:241-1695(-)
MGSLENRSLLTKFNTMSSKKQGKEVPKQPATVQPEASASSGSASSSAAPGAESQLQKVGNQQVKSDRQLYDILREVKQKTRESSALADHEFWDTQPVPKIDQEIGQDEFGEIETKTLKDVRQEPYGLPEGFSWVTVDVSDEAQLKEVYELLNANYVEDDDCMFRFDYSPAFLRWALTPPGYQKEWHIGVRMAGKKEGTTKLVGFITGIPQKMRIRGRQETHSAERRCAEINFLCVHKKLRSKRLAPVLIKEVTRRVNLTDCWQAVYTAGVLLPKPVASCRYFHRSLNPKKLLDVGFSHLGRNMTISRTVKLYKLADKPELTDPPLRPMTKSDVPHVTKLIRNYLQSFHLYPEIDDHEVAHWLLPQKDVVYTYVRPTKTGNGVTDVCSFYNLPSSILNNEKHNHLRAAYSYYNVATTCSLKDLMNDALIFARDEEFDVFNALDVMENESFFKDLKFGQGDGHLQYYVYNWKVAKMEPKEIGLVLL